MSKNLQAIININNAASAASVSPPPIAELPVFAKTSSGECHGVLYDALLVVPAVLFVLYLAVQAKNNMKKLYYGRSHIMISYYTLLWLVSALNLAWCSLQAWQCSRGKEVAWDLLSLFTSSGMLYLEISLVAFLLQESYASGLETLARTFIVSGIIVGVDIILKAIYVFGFGYPLFIDVESTHRIKWGLWIIHKLLLTAVATALFACVLAGIGAGFGIWLYNLTVICYHSLYLPFLFVTLLAGFLQEEDFLLDNAYYSEMKDAGFFDADWD
ncbi:hypothetical protein ACOSQ2_026344 [Xanthoceras sorbifolium]